jgi:3-oxoacyl-[acyl-carrier-protein] synthase III
MSRAVITGWGSYIPSKIVKNDAFLGTSFYTDTGIKIEGDTAEIIRKFEQITGIKERRYAAQDETTSDMGYFAAKQAIECSGLDPESIDLLIMAHNFGDVRYGSVQSDSVPALAARVKQQLGIKNPACVAYDVLFGCPGWVQGMILAYQNIKGGFAKKCLVVGSEMLSRVVDKNDRDSMIFADGAGAAVIESLDDTVGGILSYAVETHSTPGAEYLYTGCSNVPDSIDQNHYIKMKGRKIYEFALNHVPLAMKACLDKAGVTLSEISKILLHQANAKMDEAIIHRLFKLYGISDVPENIAPMSVQFLGNSSVGTVPTLFDMIARGKLPPHEFRSGDLVLMASVGAGMHINALAYRLP